jgi:5'-AMP-activated protein kinase regulatory gamma subunit
MVVSVITQYRILKFIAVNVKETQKLRKPLIELPNVGTYSDLATATMDTPVMDVIHMLVKKNISSVPIVDKNGMYPTLAYANSRLTNPGVVLNVFEAVDVIALIKGGVYDDLNLTVGDALLKRSDVRHPQMTPRLTYRSLTLDRTSPVFSPVRYQTTCQRYTTRSAGQECTASS